MNPNASNRKDIRAQEKAAARLAANDREVIVGLMSTIIGRSWIHSKLELCHIFSDPFSGDALLEAYRKGERNIGLALLADLHAYCPDQYILMMREHNERSTAAEYTRSQNTDRGTVEPSSEPTAGPESEPNADAGPVNLSEAGYNLVEYPSGPQAH